MNIEINDNTDHKINFRNLSEREFQEILKHRIAIGASLTTDRCFSVKVGKTRLAFWAPEKED